MAPHTPVDPAELRSALLRVVPWLRGDVDDPPARADLAAAVRLSARTLEQTAPGASVEVRVPPFVAVQCIEGLRHTRGTPPNVVETEPHTWLLLATGLLGYADAVASGKLDASGNRSSEIARWLPLMRVGDAPR
ncbi:MAG: sterol carrier family protein [Rhodococcus sp. (in: high G+C Gram-positive bacteria)]|uniref:sterol carrier family protein n=1 Tax=Rhodococcus sp. TaxID=1831 RepID=UPI003BB7A7A4